LFHLHSGACAGVDLLVSRPQFYCLFKCPVWLRPFPWSSFLLLYVLRTL